MLPESPLLRSALAPVPRTLVEIFRETAAQAADEPALEAGNGVLTYAELEEAADELAAELAALGIGRGDKVGVRINSGTLELYVAILGILVAGAAYVPVDADDPDERAKLVFGEADVAAVIGNELVVDVRRQRDQREAEGPTPEDDCWVIFTSGSTGKPKGVAVTHRNGAAFVDAESRMFLQEAPIGVGDRVMAGLSVAFDASCEEIWLAWRYGACLVPAPRALVRSGVDVGPWLIANRITIVSTVPTLVALWPPESLVKVRLLITGGEAMPPELATRLQAPGREVWNTYGPTEATVVACGALVTGEGPIRIGLPLDGWDLEVVDPATGVPVADGQPGELIIGGVGLARYLDPVKDADKYAPMPTLGWERAYRSGDMVIRDPEGLLFGGRADDQIKLGGRRIELGEIDNALLNLDGVKGAAAAIRTTAAGNQLLVGYLAVDATFDQAASLARLRDEMPAALVPRLAILDDLPTRTSGKVDRDALPWPLPRAAGETDAGLEGTQTWLAELWLEILGAEVTAPTDDFFDLGGGSLTAAQLVSKLRERFPEVAMGDVYEQPTIGRLGEYLDQLTEAGPALDREVPAVPLKTRAAQVAATIGLRCLAAPRWMTWIALASTLAHHAWSDAFPELAWPVLVVAALLFLTPPGRMLTAVAVVRGVLAGVDPGDYPRGGKVHLRLWFAEHAVDELAAANLSGAPLMTWYARLLGCSVGKDVDLHSLPPVTGFLTLGSGASIEPEVDLSGHWIDGDTVHVGRIKVGAGARIGARSMLLPGSRIGAGAEIAPGSAVFGSVPEGEWWSGSPAVRGADQARGPWREREPRSRLWVAAYAVSALGLAALPLLAVLWATRMVLWAAGRPTDVDDTWRLLLWAPLGLVVGYVSLALFILLVVRTAGLWIRPGVHPVRSFVGLGVWTTIRVLDDARTWLFPLYASSLTPVWLRLLGARIGKDVEASTVLMIPSLTQVNDLAFLADDTLIGGYELGGGWIRVERVKIGKRAFVGNSGMAAPGRKVPKASLVAVLSAAPNRKHVTKGVSYLGSPPAPLRRTAEEQPSERTYRPTTVLRTARAVIELCRLIPAVIGIALYGVVVIDLLQLWSSTHWWVAVLLAGPTLWLAGIVGALIAVAAKWALVGRLKPGGHPLWSSFVWRNELADTFIEVVAAPWFANHVTGSPLLTTWFRALGAHIGKGVWCESYWLPETDLVTLGDGATVNAGTVVQTHLFHDRLLALDTVTLKRGATLGPNSVILPAATLGRHATVGPVSLVMRGESVPDKTAWIGNPIGPWAL
ncbi:Pls/PosA family non-ribosomal peptide synthetase [Nocardioides sp. Kera G14]|uniref:Pls/PosA family non-ribosomal peptide synthetase n=1 Tax=Nocardioides sp. Kera G14 TaxID=2884264 RepID=UPI001D0F7852|nr:Pls/PosA family non-ribosomal peptide synthetase [Nocardioides sp. Kera G14]UDY24291.1 AMP-binding protein [Nocardioides sp. Kera G14]